MEYRSGGDAPTAFQLDALDDGSVRYRTPGQKERAARLSEQEFQTLAAILSSPDLQHELGAAAKGGYRFGCCDSRELALSLEGKGAPIGIELEGQGIADSLAKLIDFLNRVGRKYFGRNYKVPIEVD